MVRSFTLRLIFLVTLTFISGTCLKAQGDLLISPLRVVFEGNKKSQEINLANVGKDTASYVISIVDYRMKEDGNFEQIDTPDAGQNFAGPFIRFFPRKVTLAPNEAQVVKLQLIKTNEITAGEYRSHLYFRSVPDERPLGDSTKKKDTGISIQLTPIFGITIPVIVRSGEYNADASLSDVLFYFSADSIRKPMVHVVFNRTGDMSIYGDLKIEYISPGGKATQVKLVKGVGVYTPIPKRNMNIELESDKGIDYHSGKLHLAYTIQTGGKTEKTIETEIALK